MRCAPIALLLVAACAPKAASDAANPDSGKRVALNRIAGFLDRVGRHVLSAFVLAARHVAYAVTQILRDESYPPPSDWRVPA